MQGQGVTGVKYQMRFDTSTCLFDCYVIITQGSATTIAQRVQSNAQYSILVPTGSLIEVDSSYMPLQNNQTYTGTMAMTWSLTNQLIAPCAQPQHDFYSIIPVLAPASFYNNISTGDTIRLFSLRVSPIPNCAEDIRIFENGVDPNSSAPCMQGADFSCGFTIGGASQDYTGNLPRVKPPLPKATATVSCGTGIHIDLTANTTDCQKPLTYQWAGPNTSTTNEDINIAGSNPANNGFYNLTITDAYGCSEVFQYYGESKPSAGIDKFSCAGGSIILNGTTPNTGTWSQDTNNGFGASITSTSGGNATVNFNPAATGDYYFIYNATACADTMKVTVENQDAGFPPDFQDCFNTAVVTMAANGSGIWSLDPSSAGNAIISPINSPNATVSGFDNPGNYILVWTNGACSDDVVISVGNNCSCPIQDNIISDPVSISFCGEISDIFLTGTTPTPGGGIYVWEHSDDGFNYFPASGNYNNKDYTTGLLTEGEHYFRRKYSTTSGIICEDISNFIVITITERPVPPVISSNSPICEGQTIEITSQFIGGALYQWTGPFEGSTEQNVYIFDAKPSNSGTYSLIVEINGCQSFPTTTDVVVLEKPATPIINSNAPLCTGDTLQLSTPFVAGATYLWTGPGFPGNSTDRTPEIINMTSGESGNYQLSIELGGCKSDDSFVFVDVKNNPTTPQFISNSPICEGDTLEFLAQEISGGIYTWTGPGVLSPIHNPVISSASLANTGKYTLKISLDGCESSEDSLNVIIKAKPQTPVISTNAPICEGDTLKFTSNFIAASTYSWTTTADSIMVSTEQNPFRPSATTRMSGDYSLRISSSEGCISSPATVSAQVKPIPATPSVTNNGPLCEGSLLQFTAIADTLSVFAWSGPDTLNSIFNPSLSNVVLAQAGIYTLKVTVNGCESAEQATTVVIKPKPVAPDASYNEPICAGANLLLSADSVLNATYLWTGPGGFTSNVQHPIINNATVSASGIYKYKITVNGCDSDLDSISVTVKAKPAAPTIVSNTPLCEGSELQITTPLVAGASYSWTGPVVTSTNQNVTITNVALSDSGTYKLKVIVDGCESNEVSTQIVVNANPTLPLLASNAPVCEGDTIKLSTTSIGVTYTWSGPDLFSSSVQQPVILNASALKAGNYVLFVTSKGCNSMPATIPVVVKPNPALPIISSNSPVCEEDTLRLFANDVVGATYMWLGPDNFSSFLGNPIRLLSTTTWSGNYTLKLIVDGCESLVASTPVVIHAKPGLPIGSVTSPLCEGDDLMLSTNVVTGATYTWTYPSGNMVSGKDQIINNVSQSDAGTYEVKATVNGCESDPKVFNVVVKAKPTTPVASANSPLCEEETIQLSAGAVTNASYNWYNPGNILISSNQTYDIANATPAMSGNYTVKVVVNGCESELGSVNVLVNGKPATPVATATTPLCEGENLMLSTAAVANATYEWKDQSGVTIGNTQNVTLTGVLPTASGKYTLVVTVSGCASEAGETNVLVNGKPTTPVINTNSPLCEGEEIQLTTDFVVNGNYEWTDGNGLVVGNLQNLILTDADASMTGSYHLKVEVNGCEGEIATGNVLVYGKPATPIPTVSSPVCEGETIYFSTSVISNASYQWYDPTGSLISSSREFEIIGAIPGMSGDYSLKLTVNGCDSDLSTTTVLVNGKPALPEILGTLVLCEGEDLTLTTNIVSGASYEWKNQVGQVVGTTSALDIGNIQLNQAGNYSVQHTINGCPSELTNVNVVVNALPAKPVASANSPLCEEETIQLSAGAVTNASYNWYNPGNILISSNQTYDIANATPAMSGNYTVKVVVNGCESELGSVNVLVNGKPAPPVATATTPLCEGENLMLSTAAVANATYEWKDQSGVTIGNTQNVTLTGVVPTASGKYTLVVTVSGCASEAGETNVLVNGKPSTPVINTNSPLCEGEEIQLTTDFVVNGNYEWTDGNGLVVGNLQNLILTDADASMTGSYHLKVEVNGCEGEIATGNGVGIWQTSHTHTHSK
ncbi:MAG: hypothetical protein IPN29_18705 [Saprospiraceae bacterium]|nr:hypothetical protein [Saprospiraceae bacterium]